MIVDVEQRIGPVGTTCDSALTQAAPATRADASTLRRSFRGWIDELADPDTADDLALAVYEALANVVDHAYDDGASGRGEMRLWAAVSPPLYRGRDLVVTVSDDGAWRSPGSAGWRGRGLSLMRCLTQAVVFSGAKGTTVQMRRRIAPAEVYASA